VAELQISGYFHGLHHRERWLQKVFLHYVTAHFSKRFHVSGFAVNHDRTSGIAAPDEPIIWINRVEQCDSVYANRFATKLIYLYPASTFISVLFPAPDGPRIAVSSPDLNKPLTLRSMIFDPVRRKKKCF
jgi:hypothetical protein